MSNTLILPTRLVLLLMLSGAAAAGGCSHPSILHLEQSRLSSPERWLELSSEQVYWSQHDGLHRVLAEIPLPGADTGRPTYLLYLRAKVAAQAKESGVRASDLRGFLIQTRGARKGLTPVSAATVTATTPPTSARGLWHLELQLTFEDHSVLTGSLTARRDDWKLLNFETHTHLADVQGLIGTSPPGQLSQ